MLISTKGRYAVRIMLDVALNGGGAVRVADISLRQGITPKYAEQITSLLVKAGLLRSVRGACGGYYLAKSPEEYKISEILYKTEGDLAPVDCIAGGRHCSREESCASKALWDGLYRVMNDYLEGITLKDLMQRAVPASDDYCI